MTTIAEEVLTELSSTTEQSGEGPGQPGGIARSVAATQKSILRQVSSQSSLTEQSGEGPGQSGGIARSVKTAPNAKSALGGKGVKRKINMKSIDSKYEAIMAVEKGEKSKSQIARDFGVPANTLSTWLKNKENIIEAYQQFNPKRKNTRTGSFHEVEAATLKWFKAARDQNIPISGPMLVTKAEEFAGKLDQTDFKASNGWLENFKSRQGITFKRVCGEEKSVDTQSDEMTVWKEKLNSLLTHYAPQDIFNADETGIFFRMLPDKTLEFKDVKCHGGKKNKERLTAMVCANMDGTEKLPLLIIGKSANPRCLDRKSVV